MSDDRQSYDERREKLVPCACGRLVSNPSACAGTCLLAWRERQIAGIRQRQEERRMAAGVQRMTRPWCGWCGGDCRCDEKDQLRMVRVDCESNLRTVLAERQRQRRMAAKAGAQ